VSELPEILSHRMKRLPPYLLAEVNELKHAKRKAGVDLIDLAMGNPNDPTPEFVAEKLAEAAQQKVNQRYSASRGIFNLRREVARKYAAVWNVELDPDREVLATIGSKEGLAHLCLAMLGAGDTVFVPLPAYPVHIYSIELAGANVLGFPLLDDEAAMLARIDELSRSIYPRPKMLILNFPHNPTARMVSADFFEGVVALARARGFYVIHDFAYGETVFDGLKAPSFLQTKGAKEVGVEFTSMSKAYNMAGWRVGFCAGHPEIVGALAKIKSYYDYGMFQAIQIASILALRSGAEFVERQAGIYARRRDVLCDGLARVGWPVEKPKATMFVWARIPEACRAEGSMKFARRLLEEAEVVVSPGSGCGPEGEGFVRIALVENEERIRQAVRQIGRALRK